MRGFNKNNTGHKPLLVLKNDRFTAENINLIRSFVERNPGVLNVAGPSARDLNSPIKGPILQKAAGNIEKLLTEALKIYKSPNEVSSGRANQLVKSETSLRQEMANQLEIEVDALIDRTADINEPTHIINKEIRHIADLIRGKKVRNKDEKDGKRNSKKAWKTDGMDISSRKYSFKKPRFVWIISC